MPQKYWDLYERNKIPVPANSKHPENAPELAIRSWGELEGYTDIPNNGQLTKSKVRELRHGYYACVSYVDAQVGRLMQSLQDLSLAENTLVLLWGDHGFHLGEQGLWTKANNYELSTRVPLILSVPGETKRGIETDALVELVDVYPTLGPLSAARSRGSGRDQSSAVDKAAGVVLKQAAFSQYPRSKEENRHRGHGEIMGYAIRTSRYRYVEWRFWQTQHVTAAGAIRSPK